VASLAQLAKGVAKVALATVFTGPLAGAREAGVQAVEIASGADGGSTEKRVLDRVAKEVEAVAAGQNIATRDAQRALEVTKEILRCHALTLTELTDVQMNPTRAAAQLLSRGAPQLRDLDEAADALCRRAIESTYAGLLTDPAVLPGLERVFQQRVLARLETLADVSGAVADDPCGGGQVWGGQH